MRQFTVDAEIILFFFSNILDLRDVGILLIAINTLEYIIASAQNLLKVLKEKIAN